MRSNATARHWHVRVTVAGDPVEPLLVRAALHRLSEERPFFQSMSFTGATAQVEFWDEGTSLLDVASLALRLWTEHRASAGLPQWEVVGLEVVEKSVRETGGGGRTVEFHGGAPAPLLF